MFNNEPLSEFQGSADKKVPALGQSEFSKEVVISEVESPAILETPTVKESNQALASKEIKTGSSSKKQKKMDNIMFYETNKLSVMEEF